MKNPYSLNSNDSRITSTNSIRYHELNNENNEFIVDHNLIIKYPNSGTTNILKNGDRVWRVGFFAPNAVNIKIKLININFKENTFLHIYDKNYSIIKGPYSSELNISDIYISEKIKTNTLIIEYYVPKKYCGCNASLKAILNISNVIVTYTSHDIDKLKKGWNLISSINKKFNIDYDNSTIEKNILYELDNGKYKLATKLEYGKAYWIKCLVENGYINFT
mgnify:CR=1 FL=1